MNRNLLIDAIVRQTMVLIAQLATSGGRRAPLADVANQVFLNLVHELQAEGLGNKLIADMFGVSLRTYYDRVRRLSESATMRGRSLWEALLSHIRQQGTTTRAQVLLRFRYDDDAIVKSVLRDLATTGLIEVTGKGDATRYTASEEALASDPNASEALVWVAIYNARSLTATELAERVRLTRLPTFSAPFSPDDRWEPEARRDTEQRRG